MAGHRLVVLGVCLAVLFLAVTRLLLSGGPTTTAPALPSGKRPGTLSQWRGQRTGFLRPEDGEAPEAGMPAASAVAGKGEGDGGEAEGRAEGDADAAPPPTAGSGGMLPQRLAGDGPHPVFEAGWDPDVAHPVAYSFRYTAGLPPAYRAYPAAELHLRPIVVAPATEAGRPETDILLQITGDPAALQPANAKRACKQMMSRTPEDCDSGRPAEVIVWAIGPSNVRGSVDFRPKPPAIPQAASRGITGFVSRLRLYDAGVYTVHVAWYFSGKDAAGHFPTLTVPLAGSPFKLDVTPVPPAKMPGVGHASSPAGSCLPGRDDCHWCNLNATRCEMCRNGAFLHAGGCVAKCPEGLTPYGEGRYSRYCRETRDRGAPVALQARSPCTNATASDGRWVRCRDVRGRMGGDVGCLLGGWVWLPADCHFLVRATQQ